MLKRRWAVDVEHRLQVTRLGATGWSGNRGPRKCGVTQAAGDPPQDLWNSGPLGSALEENRLQGVRLRATAWRGRWGPKMLNHRLQGTRPRTIRYLGPLGSVDLRLQGSRAQTFRLDGEFIYPSVKCLDIWNDWRRNSCSHLTTVHYFYIVL